MILPITAFGHTILRKVSQEIDESYEGLDQLIEDMFETMHFSEGVGLAAPQINKSIRLFIIDASPFGEDKPELEGFKRIFINPIILEEEGEPWDFKEGCLSIPEIREEVRRKPKVTIEYYDRDFNLIEETFDGIVARIIQHEYDHLDGIMFVDKISPVRKLFLKKRLHDITTGNIRPNYKMIYPSLKKGRK